MLLAPKSPNRRSRWTRTSLPQDWLLIVWRNVGYALDGVTQKWACSKKVKLSLCHEDIWGSGGIAPPFLTSALDWGEWLVQRIGHFTLGETTPGTHLIGGSVGPRAGLDDVMRKILHCREPNPGRPARRYTDWPIPT
jgi:hypothetical protein